MDVLGRQVLCDFWDAEGLDDEEKTRRALRQAVDAGGARLVEVAVHHFSPWGVSGVAVIAESHLAIHTWPERGYAAIDLFTCGTVDVDAMLDVLIDAYKPATVVKRLVERGAQPELELELQALD